VLTGAGGWWEPTPGVFVTARVTGTEGVDLIAEPLAVDAVPGESGEAPDVRVSAEAVAR